MSDELADLVVENAKTNIDLYQTAKDLIGFYQLRGEELPQALKRFVLDSESDGHTAPIRKKGKKATSKKQRRSFLETTLLSITYAKLLIF